jgi:hypothetical protein
MSVAKCRQTSLFWDIILYIVCYGYLLLFVLTQAVTLDLYSEDARLESEMGF